MSCHHVVAGTSHASKNPLVQKEHRARLLGLIHIGTSICMYHLVAKTDYT